MSAQTEQSAETVTVGRVDWAPVPRVNLLPPEILAARGFRKVKARLVMAVVVTLLVAAGGVVWAQSQVNSAQDALDATDSRTAVLHREEARYAQVPKVTSALAAAQAARATALAQDLLWYRLLNDVALAAPANVWLTSLNVTLNQATGTTTPGGAAAAGADVLTPAGLGKVTVTGTARSYPDVAAWLEAVTHVSGLDVSTLQTVTRAGGSSGADLQFTTTVVISEKALSHRFDRKAG
ncbi:MAG TPA: PilN domain-containing protein [Kineosporiaceae bacterium]|nr:PilN domain-containing protein [Kineosporiaceae bacterium]